MAGGKQEGCHQRKAFSRLLKAQCCEIWILEHFCILQGDENHHGTPQASIVILCDCKPNGQIFIHFQMVRGEALNGRKIATNYYD